MSRIRAGVMDNDLDDSDFRALGIGMRRKTIIAASLIVACWAALAATPSLAAEPVKADVEQAVSVSPVALPIIVDGRLTNYVFVTIKVLLTPAADPHVIGQKEPYFRDALVRAAHRTPFVLKNDYNHIDAAKLSAVMMREATAITGPNVVRAVVVVEQTPQHQLRMQRPTPANPH